MDGTELVALDFALPIPITEEWLRDHGWKLGGARNDAHTQMAGFRIRPVADDLLGGRMAFQSHDDLCIAVAPMSDESGQWFVWIYQLDPYRHIHVRHMRLTWELIRLWEGLTGNQWSEPK